MIDYFALLQQPRRPWLDPEELKQAYQKLAFVSHPDRQATDSDNLETDFAAINEAYRVLTNPKLRLHHLLNLEGHLPANESAPAELMEIFTEMGRLVQELDRLLEKLKSADNALTRALLRSDILDKRERCNKLLTKLKRLYAAALQELKGLDDAWNEQPQKAAGLLRLYHRMSYLMRWTDQLEERQFQLSL